MHFAQPPGNVLAPWRAEITGTPSALQQVQSYLKDTLEHGAVRVVGTDQVRQEEVDYNLRVTVKGLQERFIEHCAISRKVLAAILL
eukprot:g9022.t1